MAKMTKEQKEIVKERNCAMLEKIELLLLAKCITKGEFYAAIPIDRSSISAWRAGDSSPSAKKLKRISEFLDVDPSYLIPIDAKKESTDISTDELRSRAFEFMDDLTPEEIAQVRGYVAALRANRKD